MSLDLCKALAQSCPDPSACVNAKVIRTWRVTPSRPRYRLGLIGAGHFASTRFGYSEGKYAVVSVACHGLGSVISRLTCCQVPAPVYCAFFSAEVIGIVFVGRIGTAYRAAAKRWRMVRLHKQTKEALSPGNTFGEGGGAGNVYEHRQRHKVVQNVLAMAAAVTRTSGLTPARRRAE